jgi:hypothetical protein
MTTFDETIEPISIEDLADIRKLGGRTILRSAVALYDAEHAARVAAEREIDRLRRLCDEMAGLRPTTAQAPLREEPAGRLMAAIETLFGLPDAELAALIEEAVQDGVLGGCVHDEVVDLIAAIRREK